MSKGAIAKKNQEQAAYLLSKGIYHGKRITTPMHNNYPNPGEVGSAAYRRMKKK